MTIMQNCTGKEMLWLGKQLQELRTSRLPGCKIAMECGSAAYLDVKAPSRAAICVTDREAAGIFVRVLQVAQLGTCKPLICRPVHV